MEGRLIYLFIFLYLNSVNITNTSYSFLLLIRNNTLLIAAVNQFHYYQGVDLFSRILEDFQEKVDVGVPLT